MNVHTLCFAKRVSTFSLARLGSARHLAFDIICYTAAAVPMNTTRSKSGDGHFQSRVATVQRSRPVWTSIRALLFVGISAMVLSQATHDGSYRVDPGGGAAEGMLQGSHEDAGISE